MYKLKIIFSLIGLFLFSYHLRAQIATETGDKKKVDGNEFKLEFAFINAMNSYISANYEKAGQEFNSITESNPTSAAAFYMLSKCELNQNKLENALAASSKSVNLEKENYDYLIQFVTVQEKLNNYKEGISTLKKVIKLKPGKSSNYYWLADFYHTENKPKDELEVLNDIEKEFGVSQESIVRKQKILISQNKVEKAINEGNKLTQTDPNYNLQQAKILLNNGKSDQAIALLKQSITDSPNFLDAYGMLSEIYKNQGNQDAALNNFEIVNNLAAASNSLKINVFQNYMASFQNKLSAENIDNLLKINQQLIDKMPNEGRLYILQGDLLAKKGDKKASRDAYLAALNYDKSIYEVWVAVCELDANLGLNADLVKHSEKALEYFPNQGIIWYNNGFGNLQLKNYDEALLAFEEAKRLSSQNPKLLSHINNQIIELQIMNKKYAAAEKNVNENLKANPEDSQTLQSYCFLLILQNKELDKAKEIANQLQKTDGNNPKIWLLKSKIAILKNDLNEADKAIDQALKFSKNEPEILKTKGDILDKMNKKTEAEYYWKQALEIKAK